MSLYRDVRTEKYFSRESALEWSVSASQVEKPSWNSQSVQVKSITAMEWSDSASQVAKPRLGMVRQPKSSGETALEWSDSASQVEKPP